MKIFAISFQMAQNDPKNYAASGTQSGQLYCPEMEEILSHFLSGEGVDLTNLLLPFVTRDIVLMKRICHQYDPQVR